MPHTDAGAGFGRVGFEEWLTTLASEFTQDLAGRDHYPGVREKVMGRTKATPLQHTLSR